MPRAADPGIVIVPSERTLGHPGGHVLSDVRALLSAGDFEAALELATRRSVECIQSGREDAAARALVLAGEALCTLNQPLRARAFALEALDLAERGSDVTLQRHAQVLAALALLRVGEIDRAEGELASALRGLAGELRFYADPLAMLVGAEVALATDRIRDARAFGEAACAAATAGGQGPYRARSLLVLGACATRERGYKAALRFLTAGLEELAEHPDAESAWQMHAALAKVNRKLGRTEAALQHDSVAASVAQRALDALSPRLRAAFLGSPTVSTALGTSRSGTTWSRVTPEIATLVLARREGDEVKALGPLVEAFRRLNAPKDLGEILPAVVEAMIDLCGAHRGTIALFDGEACITEVSRAGAAEAFQPFEMGVARVVLRLVRGTGQPFLADDVRTQPALDVRADHLLSVLCVPIRIKGEVRAAVYVDTPGAFGAFEPRDLEVAKLLAEYAAVALENILVRDDAIRDGLTLLYSQSHVEECLEREITATRGHGRPCGVLMIDIDDFKLTNDGMGHAAGNDLLRALAPMLSGAVRSVDVVARIEARAPVVVVGRYGGDEFEIVLPDTGREGLAAVARRVLEAVRGASFPYEARTMNVTVSIGGACFPGDASSARQLMQRADEALYQAKKAGKNRYHGYSDA